MRNISITSPIISSATKIFFDGETCSLLALLIIKSS
jgi:hypothetical protein